MEDTCSFTGSDSPTVTEREARQKRIIAVFQVECFTLFDGPKKAVPFRDCEHAIMELDPHTDPHDLLRIKTIIEEVLFRLRVTPEFDTEHVCHIIKIQVHTSDEGLLPPEGGDEFLRKLFRFFRYDQRVP